jgi:anti-sigma B factor antagonist
MEISSLRFADAVVVSVVGKIDFASSPRLDEALAPLLKPSADGPGAIVVDFAGVHFISSPGLRLLMIAAKTMHARQAAFAVASLDPFVDEVVRVTGFNELFCVFPSVRDALRSLSGPALAAYERATDPPLA